MSLALYMDEQIPRQITAGLRLRGVDVITAQEDGRSGFPDTLILDRATELGRVVFSQDQDFLAEANRRQQNGIHFCGIVYARQLAVSIGVCIQDLELIAKAGQIEEFVNQTTYLPL